MMAALLFPLQAFSTSHTRQLGPAQWSYDGPDNGQDAWGSLSPDYAACDIGTADGLLAGGGPAARFGMGERGPMSEPQCLHLIRGRVRFSRVCSTRAWQCGHSNSTGMRMSCVSVVR